MIIKVLFVKQLSPNILKKMEDGLLEYELSHGIHVDYTPFAFELHNDKNEVIGVLDAFSSYSSVHIRDLWIDKNYRGQGYGKKLINELESYCKFKRFNNINTVSCEFQAPNFYKKCGFQVEFIRKNNENPKLTVTGFVKFFEYS
jgi:ribosomal protein S18 acetylase RimI-like enzyme